MSARFNLCPGLCQALSLAQQLLLSDLKVSVVIWLTSDVNLRHAESYALQCANFVRMGEAHILPCVLTKPQRFTSRNLKASDSVKNTPVRSYPRGNRCDNPLSGIWCVTYENQSFFSMSKLIRIRQDDLQKKSSTLRSLLGRVKHRLPFPTTLIFN